MWDKACHLHTFLQGATAQPHCDTTGVTGVACSWCVHAIFSREDMIMLCSTERARVRQPWQHEVTMTLPPLRQQPSAGCSSTALHTTAGRASAHVPPRHVRSQSSSAVAGACPSRVLACAPAAVWEWCPWPAPAAGRQPLVACLASHPVRGTAALQAWHGGACPAQAASAPGSPAAAAEPYCSQGWQAALQARGCDVSGCLRLMEVHLQEQ